MSKWILALVLAVCFAQPAQASWLAPDPGENFVIYAGDALVTRPFTLAFTIVGASIYLVALPFTFYARDSSGFDVLVRQPAAATFTRCWGCNVGETEE